MKGFSIIIVTWNALELLKTFLPSVTKTEYPNFEIIIADNASTDDSADWIRSSFPDVKIAFLDQNYGYCGGNNRAIPFSEKENLIFLNNDVEVTPNWLYSLNKAFDSEEVAAVQPKIRSYTQREMFEYAGAGGGFIDKYGYTFCRGRIFEELEKDQGQYDDEAEIFWASGAALAVRKEVFVKSGGFDEDFEFHMEEIDLCWRLQNQGHKILYTPESVVYHLGGGSLPMGSPRKVYYNFRNSLFMLFKNYSTPHLIVRFPIRIFLDVIAAFRALFSGKKEDFFAVARAHLDFARGYGELKEKRQKFQQQRTSKKDPQTMLDLNIITSFFFKKKKKFRDLDV
ncbi:MAG: glycosyltransferase family 2 protein [Balneolaceae bacterium]